MILDVLTGRECGGERNALPGMGRGKFWGLMLLLTMIVSLTALFCYQDLGIAAMEYTAPPLAAYAESTEGFRLLRTALCLLFSLLILDDYLYRTDKRLMIVAMMMCLLGDVFIIFGEQNIGLTDWGKPIFYAGAFIFTAVHLVLTLRNCRGLLSGRLQSSIFRESMRTLVLIIILSLTILYAYTTPLISAGPIAIIVGVVYMLILSLSLWSASTLYLRNEFPSRNCDYAALGMLAFFLCDVAVGLNALLRDHLDDTFILSMLPNFTYTPALLLLVASAYDWAGVVVTNRTTNAHNESLISTQV